MTPLASDPTAAEVLDAVPCLPVPPAGRSPAIDALRAQRAGHGVVVGNDGVMLIVRRPWLEVDMPITTPVAAYLPYGSIGGPRVVLRCGLVPADPLSAILAHLRAALPNEGAAFVIWNEAASEFAVQYPTIDQATPSRLVYRTPPLPIGWHLVCDVHSHGRGPAFFSSTDDTDDAHATKIAIVFGSLDAPDGPTMVTRLCAGGMFLPLPRSPFVGDHHAA